MNSLERIIAAVSFKEADRIPVLPQIFSHAAVIAGVPINEYVRDGSLIADCQIKAAEKYDYDAVFAVMDANVETETMGSVLNYNRENLYPYVEHYALAPTDDFKKLVLPNPNTDGRMPELLKALRILRKKLQDTMLVSGLILGPLTNTIQLLGIETALYLAIDEPHRFEQLLDFSTELTIKYGIAQIEAGAHLPIVFEPSASPSVIPKQFFREFVFSRLKRVFTELKKAGALANWLHIAGPVLPILEYYPEMNVDIANIDYYVSPEVARSKLSNICIDGNIRSLSFLESSPEKTRSETENLLKCFSKQKGFILSSGCEIPPESNPENVLAMVETARSWS
jgi:Uroporphyrinogen-III decarboxylase